MSVVAVTAFNCCSRPSSNFSLQELTMASSLDLHPKTQLHLKFTTDHSTEIYSNPYTNRYAVFN